MHEANCHQKTIKPHLPWITAAYTNTLELKRGSYFKMIETQSQNLLWEHCAELEACILSCIAHDFYSLDGEVPETVINGNTAYISTICNYEWYEWVMYNDTTCQFPEKSFYQADTWYQPLIWVMK